MMNDNNESQEKDGLQLTRTQTSRVVAGILLCNLFIFIGGYFWGKRAATISFVEGVEHDAFTDQISYSLYTLSDQEEENSENNIKPLVVTDNRPIEVNEASVTTDEKKSRYCAHLVGYRIRKSAENFSEKLAKKGVTTFVRERSGRSANGKKAPKWFQVVSEAFENKEELLTLVESIKKKEKISCVSIVTI